MKSWRSIIVRCCNEEALIETIGERYVRLMECRDPSKENQRRNLNTLPNPADNREGTI